MGSPTDVLASPEPVRYCWDIFQARGVRRTQLGGTPYRYWSSFAIAYVLQRRLSGRIDFLDAGGRDGGTLELLRNLSLHGSYTCVDLEPKLPPVNTTDFEMTGIRSSFRDFRPARRFDAILFQSCLEYVESYADIAWARDCLKPGGFIVATIACKNTRRLYWGVWAQGGRYLLDERDLAPAFSPYGLRVVWVCPLGGAVGRAYQYAFAPFSDFVWRVHMKTVARLLPQTRNHMPLVSCYRVLNAILARIDRLLPFWRTGHCVVLERAD